MFVFLRVNNTNLVMENDNYKSKKKIEIVSPIMFFFNEFFTLLMINAEIASA